LEALGGESGECIVVIFHGGGFILLAAAMVSVEEKNLPQSVRQQGTVLHGNEVPIAYGRLRFMRKQDE